MDEYHLLPRQELSGHLYPDTFSPKVHVTLDTLTSVSRHLMLSDNWIQTPVSLTPVSTRNQDTCFPTPVSTRNQDTCFPTLVSTRNQDTCFPTPVSKSIERDLEPQQGALLLLPISQWHTAISLVQYFVIFLNFFFHIFFSIYQLVEY